MLKEFNDRTAVCLTFSDEQMSNAQIESVLHHNFQQQTVLFDQLAKQVIN